MSIGSTILSRRSSWGIHMVRHALSVSPSGLMIDEKFSIRELLLSDGALGRPPKSWYEKLLLSKAICMYLSTSELVGKFP